MCRRAEAIEQMKRAADCLSETCATRLLTGAALQNAYRAVVEEPLPPSFGETLARLNRGGGHGNPTR